MRGDKRARTYDALSRWYSLLAEPSEGPLRRECLEMLQLQPGEAVLEIGSGPGIDLSRVAREVGEAGSVWGLDLSRGMLQVCQRNLAKDPHGSAVHLVEGDGLRLPFRDGALDVVLLSFTLELFEEPEIPRVLLETARVTRPGGRLGIVSLSNHRPEGLATRLYWKAHHAFPSLVDCRPIEAERIVSATGYSPIHDIARSMWGLRVSILVARTGESGR